MIDRLASVIWSLAVILAALVAVFFVLAYNADLARSPTTTDIRAYLTFTGVLDSIILSIGASIRYVLAG